MIGVRERLDRILVKIHVQRWVAKKVATIRLREHVRKHRMEDIRRIE